MSQLQRGDFLEMQSVEGSCVSISDALLTPFCGRKGSTVCQADVILRSPFTDFWFAAAGSAQKTKLCLIALNTRQFTAVCRMTGYT